MGDCAKKGETEHRTFFSDFLLYHLSCDLVRPWCDHATENSFESSSISASVKIRAQRSISVRMRNGVEFSQRGNSSRAQ